MTCPDCNGSGCVVETRAEHSPSCTDTRCASECPVPVPYLEPCALCGGGGEVPDAERSEP